MKFIGNKTRLLDFIDLVVSKLDLEKYTIIDLFSGTGSVGKYFKKKGFKVISNDIMYFSYVFQKAYIENNEELAFSKLKEKIKNINSTSDVIEYLNSLKPINGFVYKNFTEGGKANRRYFSKQNGAKIDAVRTKIEEWFNERLINNNEYYVLLAVLIDRADFIANNSGTYGAYLKIWRSMALKEFKMIEPELIISNKKSESYNIEVASLIEDINAEVLYLDPPYNSRQYSSNYHVLETIALYDNPILKGKTGIRENYFKSDFCKKATALESLTKIIKSANVKYILLSYNNEGIISPNEIKKLFNDIGEVKIFEKDYRRFRSESNHDKRQYKVKDDKTKEIIYLCKINKKNESLIPSKPLFCLSA